MTRMKESGIDWIGQIPEKWEVSKLEQYVDIFGRIGFRGYTTNDIVNEGDGAISYSPSNIIDYSVIDNNNTYISWSKYDESPEIQIKTGDVLYVKTGSSYGKTGIVNKLSNKATINPQLVVLKPKKNTDSRLINYFLNSSVGKEQSELIVGGSTIPTITQESIKKMIFPKMSFEEQQKIADFLDKKTAQLNKVKNLLEEQIQKLKDYRASLIYETVTKGLDKTVPMKDSGIDWIGQVPEGWEITKHKYIMTKVKEICAHYEGQDILSLTRQGVVVRDIESGKGKMPASFDGYQFLEKGDLLFCLFDIDVTPRCVGVVENNGLTSSAYSRFRLDDKISVYYYYYLFLSMDEDKVLLHLAKNLRHSLTEDDFGIIETVLPSYEEQLRIADYLGKVTKSIDEIVQLKQKQIDNINKQRQTLIYDYVTGKRRV